MPCYNDINGNYYQAATPTNAGDSIIPFPSAAMLSILTATPISFAALQLATQSFIDASATLDNNGGGDF